MTAMRYATALLVFGLLVTSIEGWAQQKTVSPDSETQIRALRQQVAAMRKQLNAARGDLSAASTTRESLQVQLSALQQQVDAMKRQLDTLRADVGGLRANSVWDLNGYLTFEVSNGYPTAVFRGVNVQIVNGMGDTQTVNGTGNLIVGYNRPNTNGFVCSLGVTESAAVCLANGGVWAQSHKGGSHNIVGGDFNNYSSWGGLVLGLENALSAPYTAVLGGARNRAEGSFATIIGGGYNTASGIYSSISAGFDNHATGAFAAVAGGAQRLAPGQNDWVGGSLPQHR
jgi:hypothetical protein